MTDSNPALSSITPPASDPVPHEITQLGFTRQDEFAWLRDPNWQQVFREPETLDPKIRKHIDAENAYQTALMADTTDLQSKLFAEMKGRIKEDDSSIPAPDGPFAYSGRYRTGGQYEIQTRMPIDPVSKKATGPEQILLDGDKEAAGKEFWELGAFEWSPDHRIAAYAVDDKGSEYYTIRFRDLSTGKDLPDVIESAQGDLVWAEDSKTILWTYRDENGRGAKIYRHVLGTDSKKDPLVYEEADAGFFLSVGETASKKFLLVSAGNGTTSESWLIPSGAPETKPRLVQERTPDLEYYVDDFDGHLLIHTNADNAVDFKLVTAPYDQPDRKYWKDYLPYRPGIYLVGVSVFKNYLVRLERENALPRIVIQERVTKKEHSIDFNEAAYSLGLGEGFEYDTQKLRFEYSSPTTPDQECEYDMAARTRVLLKTQEVPSGHNADDYVAERIEATARDGAKIPLTILRRKSTPVDGTAPVLLYGYGAYSYAMSASFSTTRLSLVDRGFIYVIAHIRGGADKGYQWYLDGKFAKKTNTFNDFIDSAEALVAKKYAGPKRIIAQGGSAGGLLMGAIANDRPDLFGGIIAEVPFVDVMNTMSDATLPLTPPEWVEWGNPITSAEDYKTMLAYSPYDNVGDKPYPPILITGGLTDPRVTYWEPTKWAARLRERAPNAGPYLLKINMGAGHGGASGRFDNLKDDALNYAFALKAVGAPEAGAPFKR
ncbi:MAG: S9 family peptidase [Caulobacterales bacterium]